MKKLCLLNKFNLVDHICLCVCLINFINSNINSVNKCWRYCFASHILKRTLKRSVTDVLHSWKFMSALSNVIRTIFDNSLKS